LGERPTHTENNLPSQSVVLYALRGGGGRGLGPGRSGKATGGHPRGSSSSPISSGGAVASKDRQDGPAGGGGDFPLRRRSPSPTGGAPSRAPGGPPPRVVGLDASAPPPPVALPAGSRVHCVPCAPRAVWVGGSSPVVWAILTILMVMTVFRRPPVKWAKRRLVHIGSQMESFFAVRHVSVMPPWSGVDLARAKIISTIFFRWCILKDTSFN